MNDSNLKKLLALCFCGLAWITTPSLLFAQEWPVVNHAASSAIWPSSNGVDNWDGSIWSSATHSGPNSPEWYAYWFDTFHLVNYVRLTPRSNGSLAMGFPVTFTISVSNGSQWINVRTVTAMQRPYRQADIILALPGFYWCNGVRIVANVLGDDLVGNYVFQMGEFRAGYNDDFQNKFSFVGNNGAANQAEIRSVGAAPYNPNRIGNWNYDVRNPIITPNTGTYRNIYAPSIVHNGGNTWNVYFGGFDGSSTQNDRISITVTSDRFNTFGSHVLQINKGVFQHVNNACVKKIGASDWRMAYTTYDGVKNKPGYAVSSNGASWTPNAGSVNFLMTMSGHPNWAGADVNGGNHFFFENGVFHMFFNDFANWPGVNYATSTNNINYAYQGKILPDGVVCNDIERWSYQGANHYLWGFHINGSSVYYSKGQSVNAPGPVNVLFSNKGSADQYITSIGWVTDGTRLLGALYGAGSHSSLTQNRIFARWLQKKPIFANSATYLASQDAVGPDNARLYMVPNNKVETGNFNVYAEDGTTLLFVSPNVTLLSGDIWQSKL